MLSEELTARAETVLDLCRAQGLQVATVESCTGGLVCAALTAIAGSSDVVLGGYVTYSNTDQFRWCGSVNCNRFHWRYWRFFIHSHRFLWIQAYILL